MAFMIQQDANYEGFEPSATRGGSLVRLYSKDTGGFGKIHGAYWDGYNWHAAAWQCTGYYNPFNTDSQEQPVCSLDLVTASPQKDY